MLDKMMDDIVRKYGFESAATINFCRVCEDIEETMLYIIWLYNVLMNVQKEVIIMAKKRNYKITFTTGFELILLLNQLDLKKMIHQYKVAGYKPVEAQEG